MNPSEELYRLLKDMSLTLSSVLTCNDKIKELEKRMKIDNYPQDKRKIEELIQTNIKIREKQIKEYNKLLITFKEFYLEPLN